MFKEMSVEHVRLYALERNFGLSASQVVLLRQDSRKGVQEIAARVEKYHTEQALEEQRLTVLLQPETELWQQGYCRVLGMDEVGRGPLAGPVTIAGVILRPGTRIAGVDDSKVLSSKRREELAQIICEKAEAWAVASRDNVYIDTYGIVPAIRSCEMEIVEKLRPDFLLLDAFPLPECTLPQSAIIKGDSKSLSIAAASIIAKVHRDHLMIELDQVYPAYGFAAHKGYGCAEHYSALFNVGPCRVHRRSYLGFMDK